MIVIDTEDQRVQDLHRHTDVTMADGVFIMRNLEERPGNAKNHVAFRKTTREVNNFCLHIKI